MVEVVVDVGLGLDEPEPHAFGERRSTPRRRAAGRPRGLRELRERRVEVGDAKRDVAERAALARALGVEERDLPAARVRAERA